MNPLIVVGGGQFARVVAEAALLAGFPMVGYTDSQEVPEMTARARIPYLGTDEVLAHYPDHDLVLGVGCVGVSPARQRIVESLGGRRWATVVHPRASVSSDARLSSGVIVLAGAVVTSGAAVGAFSIVNVGALIDHDVFVGAYVHLCPGATLGGGSRVSDGSFFGIGGRLRDHVVLGSDVMVGMGAVVVRDSGPNTVLVGVPAREVAR